MARGPPPAAPMPSVAWPPDVSSAVLLEDWCPSQTRVCGHIGLGVAVVVVDFGLCYCLWLDRGCLAFLPFISDLGLQGAMRVLFTVGLVLVVLLMFRAAPHVLIARHRLLQALRLPCCWRAVSAVAAMAGVATACGMAAIGFLPWDRSWRPHLVCAGAVFFGGFAYTVGSWLLAWRLASEMEETWSACPRVRRLQLPIVLACIADLAFGGACAMAAAASQLDGTSVAQMVHVAREDFGAYCSGRRGFHAMGWINWMALSEWIFVALLLAGFAASAADVAAYSCVQRSMATLPVQVRQGPDQPLLPHSSGNR